MFPLTTECLNVPVRNEITVCIKMKKVWRRSYENQIRNSESIIISSDDNENDDNDDFELLSLSSRKDSGDNSDSESDLPSISPPRKSRASQR